MSIALSSLIKVTGEDNELLSQILSSFSWERDEEQISKEGFYMEQLKICGYVVAIALKILSVPEEWSNRKRKELDGFGE